MPPKPPPVVHTRPPIQPAVPPDIRQRLPPGISMMKSGAGLGGPSPMKRPRMEHPVHEPSEDVVEDITEIEEEEEGGEYFPRYSDDFEEQGWEGEGVPPNNVAQPPPAPATDHRPQLIGMLCPNCRRMCHGVPALKEHMAVCTGAASGSGPVPPTQPGHFPQGQEEGHHVCHVCDKSFKSHRTMDNHMKKQHGIAAPRPPGMKGQLGRPKKQDTRMEGRPDMRMEGRIESRMNPEEGFIHHSPSSFHAEGPPPKEPARPVGQVAPAQRSTTPKSEPDQSSRPPSVEARPPPPPHRGGRGRGMPPGGRGGFMRPGPMQRLHPSTHPGPSHQMSGQAGPHRPDLQKLGLKFGGQISITSTANQGKASAGGGDGTGVSITKLKGDVPVGSPVNIRESGQNKHDQSLPKVEDPQIKTEPGQVKEEPKDFDPDMGDGADREGEEGEYEEYEEFEGDGVYQGDGVYEGADGDLEEEEEGEEGGEMYSGDFDGYPDVGGDYGHEG